MLAADQKRLLSPNLLQTGTWKHPVEELETTLVATRKPPKHKGIQGFEAFVPHTLQKYRIPYCKPDCV